MTRHSTALFVTILALCYPASTLALDLAGEAVTDDGSPLPFVRIRVSGNGAAAFSHTVFTTEDGRFSARPLEFYSTSLEIDAFRIGWEVQERKETREGDAIRLTFTMAPADNVAHQVPASAWLQGDPDDLGYQMANPHCANCHQLGSQRVRDFSRKLMGMSDADRAEA